MKNPSNTQQPSVDAGQSQSLTRRHFVTRLRNAAVIAPVVVAAVATLPKANADIRGY